MCVCVASCSELNFGACQFWFLDEILGPFRETLLRSYRLYCASVSLESVRLKSVFEIETSFVRWSRLSPSICVGYRCGIRLVWDFTHRFTHFFFFFFFGFPILFPLFLELKAADENLPESKTK